MCGGYRSCAWKIDNSPEVEDDHLDYLKQPLAVPPDPIDEIEFYPRFSSVDFISLHGGLGLKSNVPQQSRLPVIFEHQQYKSKMVHASEDINYFDDLFSVDLPSPPEQNTQQKLQSPLEDHDTCNMENKHMQQQQQQQCLANVENNENCINFINCNKLDGIQSNNSFPNKKSGSEQRGSKAKQQEQRSWNNGLGDQNKPPFNYMMKRMCSHCKAEKTPQWRVGPLGPKTLCNACGVRYKSGRLVPEYRPAASPTFDSFKHSNFHGKIIKRRDGFMTW